MDRTPLRAAYDTEGFARLAAAFPTPTAQAMADAVWAELARRGLRRDDPTTWTTPQPRGLGHLRRAGVFDAVATPAVVDAVSRLLGTTDWPRPRDWGGPLVTFPRPGRWAVPTTGWHLDWPARGAPGSQLLVKWLAYLSPVAPGGGGTVVLAGSHHLVARYLAEADPDDPGRSRTVRDAVLGAHPGLRDLRPDRTTTVRGVPVRVVELTGDPGDVVFLHPHLLHAAAPNHTDRPRLMLTGQALRPTPP